MAPKIINELALLVNLLILMLTATLPIKTHAFSLNLIPIDSVESPLFPKNLTKEERHQKLTELTITRAHHLRTMVSSTASNPNALRPPVFRVFSNYYVTQMMIGSQKYSPYLMIDSGSDDTWFQCEGCKNCFEIKGGSFKFRSSSTFRYLPCDHPLCIPKQCQSGYCVLSINYLGNASVAGVVSTDAFSLPTDGSSTGEPYKVFPSVVFGCGFDNRNMNFGNNQGPENVIAGILGLGSGKRSILTQLESQTNGLFAYCLPSWTTPYTTRTFLRFGNDAKIVGEAQRRVQRVKMVPGIKGYVASLVDISVNGKRLRLNPALFRGKFVVDSGAPYSVLVKDAYTAVRNEMVEYFRSRYSWSPLKQGEVLPYDLCYNKFYIRGNYTLPSLTFQFDEASLLLKPENLFEQFRTGFCLIMFPISDPGPNILGAFQQANHRFLYDVKASTLSFVSENCQNN
ncbi:Aspartic peptidase [Trema orientale]|uniref:Aspartic peptidase n=1 Tax=Trema orientale TaxID=63057 RepID=A0A2P5D869_TREOI|nr:Aspartic peptidase [Trema orientale]